MNKLPPLFFLFFISIATSQTNPKLDLHAKDSIITIIFKPRTFKTDTLRLKTGQYSFREDNIFYSNENEFVEHLIPKNNYKKIDSLKIKSSSDIIFSHGYNVNLYTLFQFKPGDIVEFDYPQDLPICKVLNRNTSDKGLNLITELKLKINKENVSELQFFIENKRFRTIEEKDKISKKIYESLKSSIDSLSKTGSINSESYALIKRDLEYLQKDYSNADLLKNPINLAFPGARALVLKSFESKYNPILLKSKNNTHIDSRIQFDLVVKDNSIERINKDFLLYKYVNDILLNFSNDDIKKYFERFSSEVSNKDLIKMLSDKYQGATRNNFPDTQIALSDVDKNTFDLNRLIKSNYANKVVFVDFWASWCGPCIAEMKASNMLRHSLKDKNIEFVYISIDKDIEKWKAASIKHKVFESGNDYIATNYPTSLFYKELNLKTIPRYLIYNKKGELVHKNAPGPSNPNLEIELKKIESSKAASN